MAPATQPQHVTIERNEQLLTVADLCILMQRSKRSVHADIAAGRIPQPIRIGKSLRWQRSEVMLALSQLTR